jgi:hypothetical protein
MSNQFYRFFVWLFIAACVAVWYFLGLSFDVAFLVVGGITTLLMYWFFIRGNPSKQPPANGNAKLADPNDLEKSGLSRDL